jgi:hypothetical protein
MAVVKEAPKEKDINQIVRYLTTTLNRAMSDMDKPFRGVKSGPNKAYIIQTEFAYLLNEIVQGPRCMLQKNIVECNNLLDQVIQEAAKDKAEKEKGKPGLGITHNKA